MFGIPFLSPSRIALIAGIIAVILLLTLVKCGGDREAAQQAKQTEASSEALAKSAEKAVETVVKSTEREASVDAVVRAASVEIDNAPDRATARAAALRAVCGLPEYRSDPACAVRVSAP